MYYEREVGGAQER